MVIGLDESLAVIAWNDRAERAFAVRSEDAIGRPIGELLPLRGGDWRTVAVFQADPPFLFVSGVVDRYTMFKVDVAPMAYAQNVSGAHNAGVFLAQLLAHWRG